MSGSQIVMIVAGAFVLAPIAAALVLIAVDSRRRPRYARAMPGIDTRSSSAPRQAPRESPGAPIVSDAPVQGAAVDRVDPGPQALRDAVDSLAPRGAEVFG